METLPKRRGRPKKVLPHVIEKTFSDININDIFDEFCEENKRLENELMFANKCLNVLITFKSFVDFISHKFRNNLNPNEWQKFETLLKEVKNVISENKLTLKCLNLNDEPNLHQEIELTPINGSDDNHFEEDFSGSSDEEYKPMKTKKKKKKRVNKLKVNTRETSEVSEPFVCDISGCGKQLSTPHTLRNHKINIHSKNKKIYICDYEGCDYRTIGPTSFIIHTNRHKGIKPYKCEYESCGLSFICQNKLDYHINDRHLMVEKRLKCTHIGCTYETNQVKRLETHQKIHAGVIDPFPHQCKSCRRKFALISSLERHRQQFHLKPDNAIAVKCEVEGCFLLVGSDWVMEKHMQDHRKKLRELITSKEFICGRLKCDFQTEDQTDLERHHKQHWTQFKFPCAVDGCEERYESSYQLTLHTRALHPENTGPNKLYKCHICDLKLHSRSSLENHRISVHSDVVLDCEWPGCDYTTKFKDSLRNHQLVHSTEKRFGCEWPECHKRFKKKTNLDNHMRIHKNDKRFACSWPGCPYRCTDSGNLFKHLRVHKKNRINAFF